jgi:hypothetical protein
MKGLVNKPFVRRMLVGSVYDVGFQDYRDTIPAKAGHVRLRVS